MISPIDVRRSLIASLSTDMRAWAKTHKAEVDALVAAAVHTRYEADFAARTGFGVGDVQQMRGPGGLVVPNPDQPKSGFRYTLTRFMFATKRGFTPNAPMDALLREPVVWNQSRGGFINRSTALEYDLRVSWLRPDGQWQRGYPWVVGGDGKPVPGKRVEGYHAPDVPCDVRCVSATGPKCECSCGGDNHGIGSALSFIPMSAALDGREGT